MAVWIFHDLMGGGVWTPPLLSRLLIVVARSGKKRSKARRKSWRNYFGQFSPQVKNEVTRGQNRSNFRKFSGIRTCGQTSACSSGTMTARDNLQKRIDSSWNALSLMCPQIWPQVNSLGSRGHQRSITSFCGKITFAYCRFTKKDIEMKVPPSYSSRQAGSNDVWHDLERSIWKFDLRSRSWPHRNRSWCISLDAHRRDKSIASG